MNTLLPSKSQILHSTVWHSRSQPVPHSFSYTYKLFLLDIDSLAQLAKSTALFSYNQRGVISIFDQDYLGKATNGLREKVEYWLSREQITGKPGRILLLTSPRYFGYVFNPVSFFYCFDSKEELLAVIAQVNNTFGDTHLYVLNKKLKAKPGFIVNYRVDKEFHVSPFNDMMGEYDFNFDKPGKQLKIQLDIIRDEGKSFESGLSGRLEPIRRWSLAALLITYPVQIWLSMPRILWQAGKLYFLRRLKVYKRPFPVSDYTIIHRGPSWQERLAMRAVFSLLKKLRVGTVVVSLPSGEERHFIGSEQSQPLVYLEVKSYNFFLKLIFSGDVGAGESYMDGDWDSSDLPALLELLSRNQNQVETRNTGLSFFSILANRVLHLLRPNSLRGSRRNIQNHYDLGNKLFGSFLDPSMTYSCAFFENEEHSLEQAQIAKLDKIIEKAGITSSDRVLEIGCGWGSFAIRAAQTTGCQVVCLTLSDQQHDYVREKVKSLGLNQRIEVHLQDYRQASGLFDKIVSIEMIEAVGQKMLATYFEKCSQLLKPGGRLVIQAITLAEQRQKEYRKGCDWIQKYIFPGCFVPSLTTLQESATSKSTLVLESSENIGIHYATTLAKWRQLFKENLKAADLKVYGNDFFAKWIYYFSYCEAGFRSRLLGTHQMVFSKMDI
jgi:cyclopropane-fatty-acyl-phospholipid synthase